VAGTFLTVWSRAQLDRQLRVRIPRHTDDDTPRHFKDDFVRKWRPLGGLRTKVVKVDGNRVSTPSCDAFFMISNLVVTLLIVIVIGAAAGTAAVVVQRGPGWRLPFAPIPTIANRIAAGGTAGAGAARQPHRDQPGPARRRAGARGDAGARAQPNGAQSPPCKTSSAK